MRRSSTTIRRGAPARTARRRDGSFSSRRPGARAARPGPPAPADRSADPRAGLTRIRLSRSPITIRSDDAGAARVCNARGAFHRPLASIRLSSAAAEVRPAPVRQLGMSLHAAGILKVSALGVPYLRAGERHRNRVSGAIQLRGGGGPPPSPTKRGCTYSMCVYVLFSTIQALESAVLFGWVAQVYTKGTRGPAGRVPLSSSKYATKSSSGRMYPCCLKT